MKYTCLVIAAALGASLCAPLAHADPQPVAPQRSVPECSYCNHPPLWIEGPSVSAESELRPVRPTVTIESIVITPSDHNGSKLSKR